MKEEISKLTAEEEQTVTTVYLTPESVAETAKILNLKRKIVENVLKKHSIPQHSPEIIRQISLTKARQTCLKHYGVENPGQSDICKEKAIKTNLQRYGTVYPNQSVEVKQKIKQTCLDKYGAEYFLVSDYAREKIKQTNMEKYETDNPIKCPEIRLKGRQTIIQKYGGFNIPKRHFKYDTNYFDSFPELCFFLYHLHNNIPIVREPIEFSFIFEGKTWHYYPDFAVDNQIYEIKGDQFLAEDGTWWCPYNHNLDGLYRERYICALKNNVNILYSKDYQKYIDWFNKNGFKKEDFIYKRISGDNNE